ncbi:uncharacterized protein TNIN_355441 [Trichonephila inaurata madagascariensis]|uniref:Uncharacterized protein n=1 Tax=Trichonephila inaurata madagascariensis TaxID=2747483 RepID=A0A8X6M8N0_9ARAC|nr:uncharacterized protein TNIN_355441 [Trichonephila inaurata madagascariensis]
MLFAEDVIRSYLVIRRIDWVPENEIQFLRDELKESPFKHEFGIAIAFIMESLETDVRQCHWNLQNKGVDERNEFGRYAVDAAHIYFEDGYSPEAYLGYCALMAGLAFSFYSFPPNGIPECACEVLALVLTAHQLTGEFNKYGGWEGLSTLAKAFSEIARQHETFNGKTS